MSKVEMIVNLMESFDDSELVDCWNEYCYNSGDQESLIYTTDFVNDFISDNCNRFGEAYDLDDEFDFNIADDWFIETALGLESFSGDDIYSYISLPSMARWIVFCMKSWGVYEDLCNDDVWALINSERFSEAA